LGLLHGFLLHLRLDPEEAQPVVDDDRRLVEVLIVGETV
jgi:hypothetical protein